MEKEKPPMFTDIPLKEPAPGVRKRGPFSSVLLFIFLAILVAALAFFAVYTVVSMSSSVEKISAMKEPLIGKTIVPNNEENTSRELVNDVRPNIRFAVFVNGKPAVSGGSGNLNDDMLTPKDGFSSITKLINKLTSAEHNNDFSKEENALSSESSSSSEKPKIIRTESWTIRRIPLDGKVTMFRTSNFPLDNFPGGFFQQRGSQEENIFPFLRKPISEKKIPLRALSASSEEDRSSVFRSPLDEFKSLISIFDEMAGSKMKTDSSEKEVTPRLPTPFIRIVPVTIKRFRILSTVRPNVNTVEAESKPEKTDLNKYKVSSEGSTKFLDKFLGLPSVKKEEKMTSIPNEAGNKNIGLSPLFQNWFDPLWPRLNVDLTKIRKNNTKTELLKNENKPDLPPKDASVKESSTPTTEREEVFSTPETILPENSPSSTASPATPVSLKKEEKLLKL